MAEESRVQKRAIQYARELGILVRRNYMGPGVETGWPDVLFVLPAGRVLWIEFKAPDGELRKIQEYRIGCLLNRDHDVYVCDNFEDAQRIIDTAYQAACAEVEAAQLPEPSG